MQQRRPKADQQSEGLLLPFDDWIGASDTCDALDRVLGDRALNELFVAWKAGRIDTQRRAPNNPMITVELPELLGSDFLAKTTAFVRNAYPRGFGVLVGESAGAYPPVDFSAYWFRRDHLIRFCPALLTGVSTLGAWGQREQEATEMVRAMRNDGIPVDAIKPFAMAHELSYRLGYKVRERTARRAKEGERKLPR
jgi:hypothetical protein